MNITQADILAARKVVKNFAKEKSAEEIFYHLLFCIGVPQTTWKKTKIAIEELQRLQFYSGVDPIDIETVVKPLRFYRRKASFMLHARFVFPYVLTQYVAWKRGVINEFELRERLIKAVKGIGMKTASQFIRNLGGTGLAIIDTHVLKYLKKQKVGSAGEYLIYEQLFAHKAKKLHISVTELDAIIWKHFSNTDWSNFIY